MSSLTGIQFPFPVVVKVSVIVPPLISAAEAEYAVDNALGSVNVPVPVVVQVPPADTVTVPVRETVLTSTHSAWSDPALAVGAPPNDRVMKLLTGLQLPIPVVVR